MRRHLTAVTVLALAGLVVALSRGGAQPAPSADDQAIRQAAVGYATALTNADLAAIAAHWTADAEYTDESGTIHKGRDAIAALFKQGLEAAKGTKYVIRVSGLRFIRPDVALQNGEVDSTAADGTTDRGKFTAVWVKSNGRWQVSSAHDLASDVPAVSDEGMKALAWLAGDWVSDDKTAPVAMSCKWILSKTFLSQEFTIPAKDGPTTVVQWFGYDAAAESMRSWVFDSKGGHAGGLWEQDGHAWFGELAGVLPDGRTGTTRLRIKYVDDNTLMWESSDRVIDGQPVPDSSVKYVRKTAKP